MGSTILNFNLFYINSFRMLKTKARMLLLCLAIMYFRILKCYIFREIYISYKWTWWHTILNIKIIYINITRFLNMKGTYIILRVSVFYDKVIYAYLITFFNHKASYIIFCNWVHDGYIFYNYIISFL